MYLLYHTSKKNATVPSGSRRPGFTIVELLIVIVVIAILAALSTVVYRGIQDNARKSVAESNLAQAKKKLSLYKAEYGSYPTTNNHLDAGVEVPSGTTYQYTSANGTNFCLTSTGTDASVAFRVTDTTNPSQGGCSDHTWPGGVAMTNMITNGDFSQGLTGWQTAEVGPVSAQNGEAVFTPISSNVSGTTRQHLYQLVSLVTGQVYYVRADIFGMARMALTTYSYPNNTANTWGFYSANQVASVTGSRAFGVRSTQSGPWGEIRARNLIIINLTESFGAGSEPTKAQMDQLMQQFPDSYFSGSVTVRL